MTAPHTDRHLDARVDWRNADSETAWVAAAVDIIRDALQRDLAAHDRALLLLSGGSTPAPVYRALADLDIDWSRIDIGLVDDRWVAPDDPASNARLVRETLLRGRAANAAFHPLVDAPTEVLVSTSLAADADAAAGAAPAALSTAVDAANARWSTNHWTPSIAVLGMGEDGHTASLFPDARGLDHALTTPDAYAAIDATGCPVASHWPLRITLTATGLAAARQRLLLLRGERKREILATAAAPGDIGSLPIRAAFAETLDVLWCT